MFLTYVLELRNLISLSRFYYAFIMINEEKNVGISLLHDLAISHKGKLVWTSSYEALQSFVREALNLSDGN